MVLIQVISEDPIILNCYKNNKVEGFFQLTIDPESYEIINKPEGHDIDVSIAYSRIFHYLINGEKLPEETTAEWG